MKWFVHDLNTGKTRAPTPEELKALEKLRELTNKAGEQIEWKC